MSSYITKEMIDILNQNSEEFNKMVNQKVREAMTNGILAGIMWSAYCYQAGGKTFDGKPLPSWEELGEERQACWLAAAGAARAAIGESDND